MLKLEVHGTNPVKQLLQVVRELPLANIPTLAQYFISQDTESRWSVPSQAERLIFLSHR